MPKAARENSADGATAFTTFFLSEANTAYKEFNTTHINDLIVPTCAACKNMVDSIGNWKAKGYRYVGEYVSPTFITISAFPSDGSAQVFVNSKTAESRLIDGNNATVKAVPPDDSKVSVELVYQGSSWLVSEIKRAG